MNKYYKNNIFIIGFGERVKADIYPVLSEIVDNSKITIFSKMPTTIQIYVIQENGKMIGRHTTNVKILKR